MAATFGLDFGTTNSAVSVIARDQQTSALRPRLFLQDGRPHPSVVWYSGGTPVVGRQAKDQLTELGLGVYGDIIRSPKMFLGSPAGIPIGGVTRQTVDVVADLLRFLREHASAQGIDGSDFTSAVMTIPVSMRGAARAELRQAALKAGVRIHQFVHEPLAALYGYLRARPNFQREIASLDRRLVLVFDWGGGTLDLTLCQFKGGVLTQVLNAGDDEVGGDRFDERIRQLILEKHEAQYPGIDWTRMQPSADSRILKECEDAKIALSARFSREVYIRDALALPGPEKDISVTVTREEVEQAISDLIIRGVGRIEGLLKRADVRRNSIEFCLATGGMIAMPAVQEALREVLGMNRLRLVENAATVIAEGAAWIAHDDLRLQLAKPLELLHADDSYVEIVPTGTTLPVDGHVVKHSMDVYCVDPRDGFAKFLFARPRWPGQDAHGDARVTYEHLTLPVDYYSVPLMERLQIEVSIDHDLIADVRAHAPMRDVTQERKIHDLEFGLNVTGVMRTPEQDTINQAQPA